MLRKFEGENLGETNKNGKWVKPHNHIREQRYFQSKTLKHWVCRSFFLYVAQQSHFYSITQCGT